MSKSNKVIKPKKKTIVVYTDGSCSGNGRSNAVGGIGIHFPNGELKDVSKIYNLGLCTNQKTELYAILTALRYIKQNFGLSGYKVYIKTDSEYSINCITKWVYGWIKNGWLTKNNTPVVNKELIEIINKYYETYHIELIHVAAHTNGDDEDSVANAVADRLATRATDRAQLERKKNGYVEKNHNKKSTRKKPGSKTSHKKSSSNKSSKYSGRKSYVNPSRFPSTANFIVELVKSNK